MPLPRDIYDRRARIERWIDADSYARLRRGLRGDWGSTR